MNFNKIYLLFTLFLFMANLSFAQVDPRTDKKDQIKDEKKTEEDINDPAPVIDAYIRRDASIFKLEETTEVQLENVIITKQSRRRKFERKNKSNSAMGKGVNPPPARAFRVRLQIVNNNPHSMWYLMPYHGSNKLPENGIFVADDNLTDGNKMLEARQYQGKLPDTYLKELLFTGREGAHFRAYYIPAGGSMLLSNFNIDCWQDSETVEFWAVKELKANDSEFLNKVLPFEIISSQNTEVVCSRESGCQPDNITPKENSAAVAPEPLRFVKANKVTKYNVQLQR